MPRHDFTFPARWTAILALALLPACGKKEPAPLDENALAAAKSIRDAQAAKDLSKKIEAFTGNRTKIVWEQYQKEKATDPRSNHSGHFLMGLDTHDGLGARAIIATEGNYSRPIFSHDASTILFTRKNVTWDAQDSKQYSTTIMRTNWEGTPPVEVADGYAVDVWLDPVTHTEWVYAVRDITPSAQVALVAKKLIRFQLSNPQIEELIWDQTTVSPDNIQLSRDGKRASGQCPWPDAGQFVLEDPREFKKVGKGAWPSMAPDNSYVSWVLDEEHNSLNLFAENGAKTWSVPLNTAPELASGQVYHPSWANHPRFLTLTGPYLPTTEPAEGSSISKGGITSEVFIGRFSEKLDKVESWLRVTDNALNDNYPAVWIENGDTAELESFAQIHETKPATPVINWPLSKDGLLFAWKNRDAKNTVELPNARQLDCSLDLRGAARFGRSLEMLLDAGTFSLKPETTTIITDALQSAMPITVEFVLHFEGDVKAAFGTLATFPHVRLSMRDGIISAETSAGIIGVGPVQGSPCHVAVVASDTGYTITLQEADGKFSTKISAAKPRQAPGRSQEISFAGGNGAGIGMSHVAVFARKMPAAEISEHAKKTLEAIGEPAAALTLHVRAKLIQVSPLPTLDAISPDKNALVDCVYEITKLIDGPDSGNRIVVKHWAMMDGKPVRGFPRKPSLEYELLLQPVTTHPELKGTRSIPLSSPPEGNAWYDISTPAVAR